MAEVITMPRLSDTMTEGKVAKWNLKVGDAVKEGDIIAEIETDKAVQDFESEFDGVLLHQGVAEGEAAPVDSILAIIGKKGEDVSSLIEKGATKKENLDQAVSSKDDSKAVVVDLAVPKKVEIPENVHIITMPRLSDTMEEGKVMKWNFSVNDAVKEGDILAEIETDKAVQDFETEYDGTLLYQGVGEGESAKVDSILAIIGPKGTEIQEIVEGYSADQSNTMEAAPVSTPATTQIKKPAAQPKESVKENKTVENNSTRVFASPLAKKMAEEKGIALNLVKGSGENGRIIKSDIENYQPSTTSLEAITAVPVMVQADSETPNSQVRNIIAKRLAESKFTAPHYYLTISLDMDNAIAFRKQINAVPEVKVSFNDMVMKAAALALQQHPQVNSTWYDDKIVHHGAINIGMAVAIEDGLLVPVLKNVDQMRFQQIGITSKDLATRARDRKLNADEMEGSTFSISNLGMLGIESFTSIINQPNSAILSVGAIEQKPVVKEGEIVVGNEMKVTLACDHRVIDGATGAEFLQTFKNYIQNPISMLV